MPGSKTDAIAAATLVLALTVLVGSVGVNEGVGVRTEGEAVQQMEAGEVMMIGNDVFVLEHR
ncbi:hypothetical protein [Streptomyces sp. NPDC002889]|uniref:hypothetical protein n=1 Tax=Streptomyces sp. NPDC002889 TaxID=3364669 RepID=UPI0036CEAE9E